MVEQMQEERRGMRKLWHRCLNKDSLHEACASESARSAGRKDGEGQGLVLPQLELFADTSVILLKHTASSPSMLENRTSSKSVSAVETLVKRME